MSAHDWPIVSLADVAESVDYGYTASATETPVGPKFLRITDIVPNYIDWDHVPYCDIDESRAAKFRLAEGDIVIARTGATVGYAKRLLDPPDSVFASYLVRVRPSTDVDQSFLGHLVESRDYKTYVKAVAGGAAQPNANAKLLTAYEFPLPPIDVQRQIGAVAQALADLIENNRRQVENLEQAARLIYRQWFVYFRYPGHEDVRIIDSELGPVPENWQVARLGDIAELAYGKALKAGDRRGGPVAVYGSGGVVGWHDEALVPGPGIVVGRKGNVGAVYWADGDFYPIDTTYYVRASSPLVFIFHQLQTLEFTDSHAAVPGLSREQAYGLPVLRPSSRVLDRFDGVLTPMYELRASLLKQNEVLREARDLLIPRLLSGELDVSGLNLDLEPVA